MSRQVVGMRDRELYARLLRIAPPWQVQDVELRLDDGQVWVPFARAGIALQCPHCGATVPGYDARERRWRHWGTCQYRRS